MIDKFCLAKRLWPINRSITGDGVRQTLQILNESLEEIKIISVPSGTQVFDWVIPDEWNISKAYIEDPKGERIVDFEHNNLHVVGYSVPVDCHLELAELDQHLHSLPEQPEAIPYVTSYYDRTWGFCVPHKQRVGLKQGIYKVVIESDLKKGVLNYGELRVPATRDTQQEVLLSTYICHPSMANNEISGPVVTAAIAEWLKNLDVRKYNYRIVFVPETIGALTFISQHLEQLKRDVIAGFNITCVGDNRSYSFLPSRNGNTLSDRVAKHVLTFIDPHFKHYTWRDRGSDERQYCAPGIDLPIASIMRTKYGAYAEYHTSLDTIGDVVTEDGLEGGFRALKLALEAIEQNCFPMAKFLGEPQMGKRGLYPNLSIKSAESSHQIIMDLISASDGATDLLEIASNFSMPIWDLHKQFQMLQRLDILNDH